jgi:hypothetical protein
METMVNWGVDGVITDHPILVQAQLDADVSSSSGLTTAQMIGALAGAFLAGMFIAAVLCRCCCLTKGRNVNDYDSLASSTATYRR